MKPFHLPNEGDSIPLFEILTDEKKVWLVQAHGSESLLCSGHGCPQMTPNRNRHGKSGERQPIPHAGHDRGSLQQCVDLPKPGVVPAWLKIEVQNGQGDSLDGNHSH